MPCYDPRDKEEQERRDRFNRITRSELSVRTRHLCEVLKHVEQSDSFIYSQIPSEILKWHKEHKKFDKKREGE